MKEREKDVGVKDESTLKKEEEKKAGNEGDTASRKAAVYVSLNRLPQIQVGYCIHSN